MQRQDRQVHDHDDELAVEQRPARDDGLGADLALHRALERFGAVHVVCNNAGVVSTSDPWLGPISAWEWVVGVNLWGPIHGIRTRRATAP